jgi:hypothetical protein
MPQPNDLSRSLLALDQNSTIIAVIEMSQSSWLVAGMLPGIERQPLRIYVAISCISSRTAPARRPSVTPNFLA